jgi:hypothetical protein
MNVKFTQKALTAVLVIIAISSQFDLISKENLTLTLVFGFGAYISLIVTELQDRITKIEKEVRNKSTNK